MSNLSNTSSRDSFTHHPLSLALIINKNKILSAAPPSPKMKTPWLKIFISLPVWGLIIGELGHGFTIYTLMNSMPKYLSDVLHYDITDNAILSALPYTTQWFGGVGSGKLADWLIKERDYSVVWIRRIMTTIGKYYAKFSCLINLLTSMHMSQV